MSELNDKVTKAIQESLPSQVATELQAFIKSAKENEDKLNALTINHHTAIKERDARNEELYKAKEIISAFGDYEKKFRELEERERNFKVLELEIRLAEAEKRSTSLHDLISQLFKSPIVRRSFSQSDMFTTNYNGDGTSTSIKTGHTGEEILSED